MTLALQITLSPAVTVAAEEAESLVANYARTAKRSSATAAGAKASYADGRKALKFLAASLRAMRCQIAQQEREEAATEERRRIAKYEETATARLVEAERTRPAMKASLKAVA